MVNLTEEVGTSWGLSTEQTFRSGCILLIKVVSWRDTTESLIKNMCSQYFIAKNLKNPSFPLISLVNQRVLDQER